MIACSSDVGSCADRGVAAGRVSQDGQILAAVLERNGNTMRGKEGSVVVDKYS
jgi:hypothetical protein